MNSFGLLPALVLCLTTSTLVTGNCNMYTQNQARIQRCHQIQECIDKSLVSNSANLYVLEKVFRSTNPRPAVVLIINYHIVQHVIAYSTNNTTDKSDDVDFANTTNSESNLNESATVDSTQSPVTGHKQNTVSVTQLVESIGWSSSGVYTRIRPAVLLSFQPAFLLWTLSFGIDNYGYPKTIDLHLNISECDLPGQTKKWELKQALEHLTAKLDYNATAKVAYAWSPSTSSEALLQGEIYLLVITSISVVFCLILLAIFLPTLFKPSKEFVKGGLWFQLFNIVQMEMDYQWKLIRTLNIAIHSKLRLTVMFLTLGIGIMVGIITIIAGMKRKWSLTRTGITMATFGLMCILIVNLVMDSIPLVVFTTIYPVEMISTVSFIVASIIGIVLGAYVLKWFVRKNYKSQTGKQSKKEKCYYHTCYVIIFIFFHILVPLALELLLITYLSLLKSLSESPISQLFQLILSFVPSISATVAGFLLTKKLGSESEKKVKVPYKSQDDLCNNFVYGHNLPTTSNQNRSMRFSRFPMRNRAQWLRAFEEGEACRRSNGNSESYLSSHV